MRRGLGVVAAGLLLSGCINSTPLPLSPLQVIIGGWPPKETAVAAASRNFTIKGDTFSYPSLGVSLTRPNDRDWEFLQNPNGAIIAQRRKAFEGTTHQPLLQASFNPLPEKLPETFALELKGLQDAGAFPAVMQVQIDGVVGESWAFTTADEQKRSLVVWRAYLPHTDSLTLVQMVAESVVFPQVVPEFESMLTSLRVPKSPNAPAEGQVGVKRVAIGVGDAVSVLGIGLALQPFDFKTYFARTEGRFLVVDWRNLPQGATQRPSWAMIAAVEPNAAQSVTDAQAALTKELDAKGQKATSTEVTIDGRKATQLEWTITPDGAPAALTFRRIYVVEGQLVVQIDAGCEQAAFAAVKAEFDALAAAVKLPKLQ